MKIGICGNINLAKPIANIGYQYLECNFSEIHTMNDTAFQELLEENDKNPVKIEAQNCFCAPTMSLAGNDVNLEKLREYSEFGFERASRLGVKIVVVGSGAARKIPDDYDKAHGFEDLSKSFGVIGESAAKHGITVAIEPLNFSETNLINSVEEGIDFVKKLNIPSVKLLADFYHMRVVGEDMSVLYGAKDILVHTHIANYNGGRTYPSAFDEDEYGKFFSALHEIGYSGRISIEASADNPEKGAKTAFPVLEAFVREK